MSRRRCSWAGDDALYQEYHDTEWGVPQRDETKLFELLILEGAQAGLSWLTILRKRQGYRKAFAGFDPVRVARFDGRKLERLMADSGIVRNRLKIAAAVSNARAVLRLEREGGSLSSLLWGFVGDRPRINCWKTLAQVPARSAESERMSKELRRRGMKFVGPTICYALMQAAGMVNDHTTDCFRYRPLCVTRGG